MTSRSSLALLFLIYFVTRLVGLVRLPMFLDESWHISWSMWIAEGLEWEVPWQYGKGLSVFVNALLFPWAAPEYLGAARAVTVCFGAVALGGVFKTARALYDGQTASVAALFQIFCPYALFHDRLVLTDPVQSAFATLALWLSVRVAQNGRTRDALWLATALVLSVFSKALGLLSFLLPALAWLSVGSARRERLKPLALAYAVGGGVVVYPLWRFLTETSTVRAAIDKSEEGPLGRMLDNAPLAWEWISSYWTLPLLVLAGFALIAALLKRERPALFLGGAVLLPLAAFLAISTLWFPRYLVFLTPPLAILAARGLISLTRRFGASGRLRALAVGLALFPAVRFDAALWTSPAQAPFAAVERFQFVNGWPSGYGVNDTLQFFREEVRRHKGGVRVVLHSGGRRTLAFALSVAFRHEGWLVVDDLRLDDPATPGTLEGWAREQPTFVVVPMPHKGPRPGPGAWSPGARLVLETRKPDGTLCDQIYALCPGGCR